MKTTTPLRVAIVVGHDKIESGAYSKILSRTEYSYNKEVASYLRGVADVYYRPEKGGYKTQMRNLSKEINKKDYDLVVELHFNMFDGIANNKGHGTEALIFGGNKTSRAHAENFCEAITGEYCTHNRGVKELTGGHQNGYWFLYYMKANAIILEPFFGDEEEALLFENPGKYARAIKNWLSLK